MSDIEELIDSHQAVKYLAQRWKIPNYSMDAFRALRHRRQIKPALATKTATFWLKSDLDKIPKPDRTNPRGPRLKKSALDGDGREGDASMMLMNNWQPQPLGGSEPDALIA